MKHVLTLITLLISQHAFSAENFFCFTTYTEQQMGWVEERAFVVNQKDPEIISDGYISSINLNKLTNKSRAQVELNFGPGIVNKGKSFNFEFVPAYAINPADNSKVVKNVVVSFNKTRISIPLHDSNVTIIYFPVIFKDAELEVRLECGLN